MTKFAPNTTATDGKIILFLLDMELYMRLRNLPMKAAPQSSPKYISTPSINTDYLLYHSDIMLTSSFFLEVILSAVYACMQKRDEVKFVKDRVKI